MPRIGLANHKLANNRWERFCLYLHAGKKSIDAYEQAGYTRNSAGACLLRKRPEIQARLNELSAQTVKLETKRINEDIMSELDRKVKLSKIANKDIPEPVKTSDQIGAIQELNKMDKIYTEGGQVTTQTINILVMSPESKELTERLLQGRRVNGHQDNEGL